MATYGKSCSVPAVDGQAALVVNDVSFSYSGSDKRILDHISFSVKPGERVALVGPNGAGKSTLIKLIVGLEKRYAGNITVYGNRAHSCHHRVALVPQRGNVDWGFPVTVRDVVMMGRYVHLGWVKAPREKDLEAVEKAMTRMRITDLADRQVGELSGGQQQRVMLARTLAHEAELLLLDEPLNHVDVPTQELIFHVLEDLSKEGSTVIVSTHDLGILPIHFSRAIFLDRSIVADGPVESVLTAETLAAAYGIHLCTEEAHS